MFTGLEGGDREAHMIAGGDAEVDQSHVGIGEERVEILIGFDLAHIEPHGVVGAHVTRDSGNDAIHWQADGIADGDDPRTGYFLICLDMGAAHEAETHHADVYVHRMIGARVFEDVGNWNCPERLPRGQELFEVIASCADIRDSLIARLAFDAEIAVELLVLEGLEESAPVDLAGADDDLLAPRAGDGGAAGVFDVALFEPRSERPEGGDGIALGVKDHVGGIEVHADIWSRQFLEERAERVGVFLAGLEPDVDAEVAEKVGDPGETVAELGQCGIVFVMGEKPGMERDEPQSHRLGQRGVLLNVFPVLVPVLVGDNPAGLADGIEGGIVLPDGSEHTGDDGDVVAREEFGGLTPDRGLIADGI